MDSICPCHPRLTCLQQWCHVRLLYDPRSTAICQLCWEQVGCNFPHAILLHPTVRATALSRGMAVNATKDVRLRSHAAWRFWVAPMLGELCLLNFQNMSNEFLYDSSTKSPAQWAYTCSLHSEPPQSYCLFLFLMFPHRSFRHVNAASRPLMTLSQAGKLHLILLTLSSIVTPIRFPSSLTCLQSCQLLAYSQRPRLPTNTDLRCQGVTKSLRLFWRPLMGLHRKQPTNILQYALHIRSQDQSWLTRLPRALWFGRWAALADALSPAPSESEGFKWGLNWPSHSHFLRQLPSGFCWSSNGGRMESQIRMATVGNRASTYGPQSMPYSSPWPASCKCCLWGPSTATVVWTATLQLRILLLFSPPLMISLNRQKARSKSSSSPRIPVRVYLETSTLPLGKLWTTVSSLSLLMMFTRLSLKTLSQVSLPTITAKKDSASISLATPTTIPTNKQ